VLTVIGAAASFYRLYLTLESNERTKTPVVTREPRPPQVVSPRAEEPGQEVEEDAEDDAPPNQDAVRHAIVRSMLTADSPVPLSEGDVAHLLDGMPIGDPDTAIALCELVDSTVDRSREQPRTSFF